MGLTSAGLRERTHERASVVDSSSLVVALGAMPRGSSKKHSKQAGTLGSEALTHAERAALGYGVVRERLGKDTVKDFDACALTLARARDGVVTEDGVMYEREAIVRCLLAQRERIERQTRAWERARAGEDAEGEAEARARKEVELRAFYAANHDGVDRGVVIERAKAEKASGSYRGLTSKRAKVGDGDGAASVSEFYRLGAADDGLRHKIEKPETHTKCPTTLKKLRMKDLVSVKWTAARDGESGKYACPITYKTLTNATAIVVLKPTGQAMSEEGFKAVVEKEGAYEGVKICLDKDVIRLQRGGTGFAGSGTQVESKATFDLGVGSGLADSRGQQRGGASKFALRFN